MEKKTKGLSGQHSSPSHHLLDKQRPQQTTSGSTRLPRASGDTSTDTHASDPSTQSDTLKAAMETSKAVSSEATRGQCRTNTSSRQEPRKPGDSIRSPTFDG